MLQSLHIKNLALVDSLQVEFQPGLNVITGETGAGKSIIVGALGLLAGGRADKNLIRDGADQCLVEGVFSLADPEIVDDRLREADLAPAAGGSLIIRRIIAGSGGGRQYVNDSPVTLQVLKRIGDVLVDLHGPHDHQSLFNPEFQLRVLDAFGRTATEGRAYRAEYEQWQAIRARRSALDMSDEAFRQETDRLAYQVQELEAAALREDEEAAVVEEQRLLGNAQQILQLTDRLLQALTEGESSAFAQLVAVQQALQELGAFAGQAAAWKAEARSLAAQAQELARAITAFAQKIEADPNRLQWLDDRLAVYQKMKRKYGGTVAEMLEKLTQGRQRLQDLQTRSEQIARLDREGAAIRERLTARGLDLRRKRQAAAKRLTAAVARELHDLGLTAARLAADFSAVEPQADGLDAVEFQFSANVGEALKPLRLIASSGEISRLMLALKAVLAQHDRIPVLVFDEIDVNVGGRTAPAVGRKLAEVASRRQVLCITHLPPVAVHGAAHYAVTKETRQGRTVSGMISLDRAGRIEEIARMLGGRDLTSVTLAHAREMLQALPVAKDQKG